MPKSKMAKIATKIFSSVIPTKVSESLSFRKSNLYFTRFLAMNRIENPILLHLDPDYWRSQDLNTLHTPLNYRKPDETTEALLGELTRLLNLDASFIEIGCNAGRNLKYLYDKGFRNLAGIEINAPAIEKALKSEFPDLYQSSKFYIGNAADQIKKIADETYDVVFSNAVLVHIPPKDLSLFHDMARVSKKFVAIYTDENPTASWPYDFEKIFNSLNLKQVYSRSYYGEESLNKCQIPVELFDERKHFFDGKMLRIFIKKAKKP